MGWSTYGTVCIAGVLGFFHAQQGDASAPLSVRGFRWATVLAFGRMYRNGHTIHTIPPVFLDTYVCIDATYKGAIHLY